MPFLYGELDWRYNQTPGSSFVIAKYKNATSYPRVLQTVSILLGTGRNGVQFTYGSTVTGDGDAFNVQLTCTGSDGTKRTSNTLTVNNTVGRTTYNNKYTPVRGDCKIYTFTFGTPVYVKNGETVNIYANISGKTANGVVVVFDDDEDALYGTTARGSVVKIHNGSKWLNAVPYVYNGSSWVPTTAYVYTNAWEICVP